jgi:hypothetical protein
MIPHLIDTLGPIGFIGVVLVVTVLFGCWWVR